MQEYEFSKAHIFPYKDRINDSAIIRENAGLRKTRFLEYFTQCKFNQEHLSENFVWYNIFLNL